MKKDQRLYRAEYGLLVFVVYGIGASTHWHFPVWDRLDQLAVDWLDLLLLLAWCVAPIVLRPLTHPGVNAQQRYAVGGLILGAGLAWFVWVSEKLGGSYDRVSGLSVLVIVGLLALAGYLRLGWEKKCEHH